MKNDAQAEKNNTATMLVWMITKGCLDFLVLLLSNMVFNAIGAASAASVSTSSGGAPWI